MLGQVHIQQGQPILKRLQGKAAQDQPDAEGSEALFGEAVGVVLDVRIHRESDARNQASHQPYLDRKEPGVGDTMRESTADQRRGNVAHGPYDGPPKQTRRNPWTTRRFIVEGRTHATRVSNDLADGDETCKSDSEFEPQNPVKSGGESQPANGAEKCFPGQGIVLLAARRSTELNRHRDSGANPREEAKKRTEAKAIADSENDRVGNRSSEQAQRAVPATEQIIGKIQAAEHVETGAGDAHGCERVVVHGVIVDVSCRKPILAGKTCSPENQASGCARATRRQPRTLLER